MPENQNDDFRDISSRISLKQVLTHYRCVDPLALIALIERISVEQAAIKACNLFDIHPEEAVREIFNHKSSGNAIGPQSGENSFIYDLRLIKKNDGTLQWKDD